MESSASVARVWEVIREALAAQFGETGSELDQRIESMKKAEIMDVYIHALKEKLTASEIFKIVYTAFSFDLDTVPLITERGETAKDILDCCLIQFKKNITGRDIRNAINEVFGINLDAISDLSGARISLYSKDQWVVQDKCDLFVVYTGPGDIDAKVYPTKYFMEKTGLKSLPAELQQLLENIGYYYDEKSGSHYFSNPSGEPVPDSFKGQTMEAIMRAIRQSFLDM